MNRIGRVLLVLLALPVGAAAQQKRPLQQADWDRWQSIGGSQLSPDGKWVAYTVNPRVGDGDFVVRSTTGTTEYHVNLGYTNRENNTPGAERGRAGGGAPAGGGGGGRGGRGGGGGAAAAAGPFSADNKFAFVMVNQLPKVQADSVERANAGRGRAGRAGGGGAAATPPSSLRIIRLSDGNIETVAGARSFRIPENNGKWLVYSPGANASDPDSTAGGQGGGRAGRGGAGGGGGASTAPRRTFGSAIVLRNLETGTEERLSDVASYTFDDNANVLAYIVTSRDSTKDGVYIKDLVGGATKTVLSGPGNYRGFTFDRNQQQFVFASDRDQFGRPDAKLTVYHGTVRGGTATPVLNATALPADTRFPDNFSASFTRAGNAITLTIAPPADEGVPADSLVGKARFDLWHWKDVQVQPTQLMQVNQARNRTFQALVNLQSKKLVQITNEGFPNAVLSDDGRVGLASTNVPYALQGTWGDGGADVNVLDPATGNRKLIAQKISGNAQLSVGGKYVAFFDRNHWYVHDIASGKTVNITEKVPVTFWNETDQHPDDPPAWGIAGWTRDDRSVLLYDRFDVWELDPTGAKAPVVLTDSVGRRERMTLRVVNLDNDEDERYVDTSRPVYLSAFDEDSKESGYYRTTLNGRKSPEKIIMAPVRFGSPTKAKNADVFMATKSTFVDFPNLYVGPSLAALNTKVSNANAFQREYSWGTAELVEWLSDDGVPRQGILYKPDGFDPTKKYPMITYFYEDLSDGLYSYIAPNGGTSVNITHYVSNGYLMFEPDIHYEMGHPGQSAMKSILPGVQMLIAKGFVDPKRIGLQGHSWGGYQIAYMITQTSLFAAAEAGAPVSNMISAYGGIRWESGINRAGQYETGQSRIGKSVWEGLPLYIENSPLFGLERVKTPLLILHNDQDGAVPWYQGIELYIGMRRLGKEAYLFNYNNELHGISGRANQKDWAMRMQQFFDTKLKGTPAPDWMINGIPAKDKGKDVLKKAVTTTN
jgi:dipeptidyl aminopeptidase/acylaminoacyl peptidase